MVSESALKRMLANSDARIADGDQNAKPAKRKKLTPAQKQIRDAEYRKLESAFASYWARLGGDPALLTPLHPFKRWEMDFAILPLKIFIEIDGGTWTKGKSGHNWGTGIRRQCIKQNTAVLDGWRPFRFTSDMLTPKDAPIQIKPLIELVKREMAQKGSISL